jgi:hypothetical protein
MLMDGQTDRHDEANSRFSQFCEPAPKLSSLHVTVFNTPPTADTSSPPVLIT